MNSWSITRPCSEMSLRKPDVEIRRDDERQHAEDRHHQEHESPKTIHDNLHDCVAESGSQLSQRLTHRLTELTQFNSPPPTFTGRLLRLAGRFERQRLDVIDNLPNFLLR